MSEYINQVKLVVVDLDDTLLRRDKSISEYTVGVFRRLRWRGVLTAFATSRSAPASARFRSIITPDIDITSGGAIATMNGEVIFRAAIGADIANAILNDLRACEDVLQITADTEWHYFNSKPVDPSWAGWIDYADAVTTDFSKPLQVPDVYKITPNITNAEALSSIVAKYPDVDALRFTGEDWYQIKSRKAAKHIAVAEVCKRLGISMDAVAAFGDDHNDVGMLRACGVGVAMGNAIRECVAAAGHVCGDCDDDGVACWIEANLSCNKNKNIV